MISNKIINKELINKNIVLFKIAITVCIKSIDEPNQIYEAFGTVYFERDIPQGYILEECEGKLLDLQDNSLNSIIELIPFIPGENLFYSALDVVSEEARIDVKNGIIKGWIGFNTHIPQIFEVYHFPFDRNILSLELMNNWRLVIPEGYTVEFEPLEEKKSWGSVSETLVTQWMIPRPVKIAILKHESGSKQVDFQISIERKPDFFIRNVAFPVFVVVGVGLCIYAFDINDLPDRLNLVVGLLLALVAFQYVVGQYLPRTDYFTTLDYYVNISFLQFLICGIESTILYLCDLSKDSNHQMLLAIDHAIFAVCGTTWLGSLLWLFYCRENMESWESAEKRLRANRILAGSSYKYREDGPFAVEVDERN